MFLVVVVVVGAAFGGFLFCQALVVDVVVVVAVERGKTKIRAEEEEPTRVF